MDKKINLKSPKIWGGAAWKFLHIVALNYPEHPTQTEKNDYKVFFTSLDKVLPCKICSNNFIKNKKLYNIDKYLENPNKLFNWTMKVRNSVQKLNGKPQWDKNKIKKNLHKKSVPRKNLIKK